MEKRRDEFIPGLLEFVPNIPLKCIDVNLTSWFSNLKRLIWELDKKYC